MCPESRGNSRNTASLCFFLYVLAAEMTPHALLNCSSTSPFRREQVIEFCREYLQFYQHAPSSCFTHQHPLPQPRSYPSLLWYVTALMLGLRHGASWMDLSKAWEIWGFMQWGLISAAIRGTPNLPPCKEEQSVLTDPAAVHCGSV